MENKFKIGDKVEIISPKEIKGTCWVRGMERNIGRISRIKYIYSLSADLENIGFTYPLSSLRLVKEVNEEEIEQPTEQVAERIDWEQRKWDLASKIYAEMENVTLESSVRQAEIFIKYYKQTLK